MNDLDHHVDFIFSEEGERHLLFHMGKCWDRGWQYGFRTGVCFAFMYVIGMLIFRYIL